MKVRLRRLPWLTYMLAAVVFLMLIASACGPRGPQSHPAPADCSLTGTYGFAWARYIQVTDWWEYDFKAAGTWREWADSTAWGVVPLPGVWSAERLASSNVAVTFEPDADSLATARWGLTPDPRRSCQWVDYTDIEDGRQWVFTLMTREASAKARRVRRKHPH